MNKYLLKPKTGTAKERYFLEDENNNTIYEAGMLKFKLFGAAPYEFKNYKTGNVEEHSVGKVVTVEQGGNDWISFMSKRSYYKYDGVKIWDFLHDKGVRIDSKPSSDKVGMTYVISFEGKEIATIASSTPNGKSFITTDMYFDVTCDDKDLDLVFLVAFSIARTNQVMYD